MAAKDNVRKDTFSYQQMEYNANLSRVLEESYYSRSFNFALMRALHGMGVGKGPNGPAPSMHQPADNQPRRVRKPGEERRTRDRAAPTEGAGTADRPPSSAPGAHGNISNHSVNFGMFSREELEEELADVQKKIKEMDIQKKGLDYVLLPNLRRELDRLALLEGSMAKGAARKVLTEAPLIGSLSRMVYGYKDRVRDAEEEKKEIAKELAKQQERLSAISDALMDNSEALEKNTERVVADEEDSSRDRKRQTELTKKVLKTARKNQVGDDFNLKDFLLNGDILTKILPMLATFLTGPVLLTAAGGIVAALVASHLARKVLDDGYDKRDFKEKETRENAAKIGETNPSMPLGDRLKAGVVQSFVNSTTHPNKGTGEANRQLAVMRQEYIDKQVQQTRADLTKGGKALPRGWEAAARKKANAEFDAYLANPVAGANGPVATVLDHTIRTNIANEGHSYIETGAAPGTPGAAPATDRPTPHNDSGYTPARAAARVMDNAKMAAGSEDNLALGAGVNINGLDPAVKKNLIAMATEYHTATGKKLPINTGKRDSAEQIRLYQADPNRAGKPGSSMHEYGLAIDTNTPDADYLDKYGLLNKYGFVRNTHQRDGKLETHHLEDASIQDSKAAIRASAPPVDASTNVATSTTPVPESDGPPNPATPPTASAPPSSTGIKVAMADTTSSGSSQPNTATSFSVVGDQSSPRIPYASPGAAAAIANAGARQQPEGPAGGGGGGASSAPSGLTLASIPTIVDNLPLILFNTGSVR